MLLSNLCLKSLLGLLNLLPHFFLDFILSMRLLDSLAGILLMMGLPLVFVVSDSLVALLVGLTGFLDIGLVALSEILLDSVLLLLGRQSLLGDDFLFGRGEHLKTVEYVFTHYNFSSLLCFVCAALYSEQLFARNIFRFKTLFINESCKGKSVSTLSLLSTRDEQS